MPGEAKVDNDGVTISMDSDIAGLQVPMNQVVGCEVGKPIQHFREEGRSLFKAPCVVGRHSRGEVHAWDEVFDDDGLPRRTFIQRWGVEVVVKPRDIWVVELPQRFNFSADVVKIRVGIDELQAEVQTFAIPDVERSLLNAGCQSLNEVEFRESSLGLVERNRVVRHGSPCSMDRAAFDANSK